ncbi:MAG: hypothetical protein SV375_21585 [Thermodesulfobacteriota bacterium]|nr:hypothetical protein [Thermodesulfobacteriota bacterium]
MEYKLNEKEKKIIRKLYKNHKISPYTYITAGFLVCIGFLGIILGIKFKSNDGFFMAIYFGTISLLIFLKTRNDNAIVKIIKKLELNEDNEYRSEKKCKITS